MSSTTYKSTAKTFNYKTATNKASPKIAYKITAKRSSNTSTKVTLKLDFSIGWNISKQGSVIKDPFEMEVTIGTQTKLSVSVKIPKCTGASGTLYDRDNTTAYNVATGSKSVEITWTSGNSLSVSGTCSQSYIGETINFSGGSISMPTYSSSGGGGGGPITIGKNSMSISISPSSISLGNSATISINSKVGTGNGISKYIIYEGSTELGSTTSTTYTVTPRSTGTKTYKVKAVSKVNTSYDITTSIKLSVTNPNINPISYLSIGSVDGSISEAQGVFISITKNSTYWAYSVGSSSETRTVVTSGNYAYVTASANQTSYV